MDQEEASASSPFAPRASLVRTPPARDDADMRLTDVPLRPYVPGLRSRPLVAPPVPPPTMAPASTGGKRPLTSPEERRPVDVVRMCRPAAPLVSPPIPARSTTPTAGPSYDEEDESSSSDGEPGSLARASKEVLFERVHNDLRSVMSAVTGPTSRLNKESTNVIGANIQDALAVVATLSLRLSEMELKLAEAKLHCKALEHEALKARSETSAVTMARIGTAPETKNFAMSYASMLRLPKKAEPVRIPTSTGPVLAFYPASDQVGNLKTAEDTKAELKRAIKPQALEVQVDRVRKIGNAGVVVQTSTPSAAQRLRSAAPPTLRVSEPQKRQPRLSLKNIDGDPTEEYILGALRDQNIGEEWSLERLKSEAKIFKRRGRQADTTTIIIECSPALRDTLISRDRVYIGWQAVEVHDHIAAVCCHKCQQYGHPERYCRAAEPTCGRCGETGHRRPECKAVTERCATCHKFNRSEAVNHVTAARACPARRYAEERAVATTNYGRP